MARAKKKKQIRGGKVDNTKNFVINDEDFKCAPAKKFSDGSCFTLDALLNMSAAYNSMLDKTKQNLPRINIRENKAYLVGELTKALEHVCSDQLCWLEQDFVKAMHDPDVNSNTFLPKIPQGKFTWLSTTNIDESVEQIEHIYPDYKFLGTVPIDFANIASYGLKNLNIDELWNKGIRRIGVVFNLDESWQSGSHWVSMFANLKECHVYFFDSCAVKPVKRIRDLMVHIANWCYERQIKHNKGPLPNVSNEDIFTSKNKNYLENAMDIRYNTVQHQYKNSECGMYSIRFQKKMNELYKTMPANKVFDHYCNMIVTDDEMNQNRTIYFRFK